MGYYMNSSGNAVRIKKERFAEALEAVKALASQESLMGGGSYSVSDGKKIETRHFSWVDTEAFLKAETLVDALTEWRWKAILSDSGDIDEVEFDGEKLGNDDVLWQALAPFVEPGSVIYCHGEDGTDWRWTFKDGVFEEETKLSIWLSEQPKHVQDSLKAQGY